MKLNVLKKIAILFGGIIIAINFSSIKVLASNINAYLNFNNITTNHGLSQGTVEDIYQDSDGYMWFATNDGLNRYDGEDFKILKGDPSDKQTLWPGLVNGIVEDKDGYLWVGTSSGLNKIDRKTLGVERIESGKGDNLKISNHNIWSIFKDSNETIWIGTEDGLNEYNYETKQFKKYMYDKDKRDSSKTLGITSIIEDEGGNILVGTVKGLRIVDRKEGMLKKTSIKNSDVLEDEYIKDIFMDSQKNIWFGTIKKGVKFYNNSKKQIESINLNELDKLHITSINEDLEKNIWIGSTQGLMRYSKKENKVVEYVNKMYNSQSLVNNLVLHIFRDKSGLMWIGTYNGISIINPEQKFINYQKESGELNTLSGSSISGIYEDNNRNLWIGTNANGLNMLNRETGKYTHFKYDQSNPNSIPTNTIWQVTGDDKGFIWVATQAGLVKINSETKDIKVYNHVNEENSLVNDDVREVFIDDKGFIWIGTRHGIDIFDPQTEKFTNLDHLILNSGVEELFVRRIFQDSVGDYWLAVGWNSGVVKLDTKNNKIINYKYDLGKKNSLSDNLVMNIKEDLNGDIWIATSNGINKLNKVTGEIVIYKEKQGLVNNYVYGILIDEKNNIWFSTNGGISKFDTKKKEFENYTFGDGLQSNEFNVTSEFKSKSGEMFFGGVNGISSFMPNQMNQNSVNLLPVIIKKFSVYNNENITYSDKINLKYNENSFTVDFVLPDYRDSNSIIYEYTLAGFDNEWRYSGTNKHAIYTNIPSGNYTFKVRARLKGGILSEVKSFNINIEKPWYLSTPAIFIYITIIILVIVIVINYVKILDSLIKQKTIQLHSELIAKDSLIEEKQKLYEEKEKLYKDLLKYEKFRNTYLVNLSHELRTPLNIVLSSEHLISSLNKEEKGISRENLDKYMKIIKANSKTLLQVINDLIDSSKIKSGAYKIKTDEFDIVSIVEDTALSMKTYIEESGLELIIDPDIEEKMIECDKVEIERCIINLVSNAIKFNTEGGTIFVGVKDLDDSVEIIVKDSGIGISEEYQSIIFDRFTQIETGVSSKHFSSGIGLNLVKDLVELHNGTIRIVSKLGEGSEFIIKLPVKINLK